MRSLPSVRSPPGRMQHRYSAAWFRGRPGPLVKAHSKVTGRSPIPLSQLVAKLTDRRLVANLIDRRLVLPLLKLGAGLIDRLLVAESIGRRHKPDRGSLLLAGEPVQLRGIGIRRGRVGLAVLRGSAIDSSPLTSATTRRLGTIPIRLRHTSTSRHRAARSDSVTSTWCRLGTSLQGEPEQRRNQVV